MEQKRNIAILGSTGSIGRQTVDIICEYPDRFQAYLLTANSSVDLLVEQAKRLKPKYVIIANEAHYAALCEALKDFPTEVKAGMNAIVEAMADENIDTVVTAMVGYAGLAPTINAIKHNKTIALANKETLVVAGDIVTDAICKSKSSLLPIDSEHSAIYQCLVGEKRDSIRK